MIKFNNVGKVIDGEYPGWYILIKDRRNNSNISNNITGGIYIFQSNNINFSSKDGGKVYDDWVQDLKALEIFFSEPQWNIKWLDVDNTDIID